MSKKIYIAAVEDSGDALGADLVRALREMEPEVVIDGIGATQMGSLGVSSPIDVSRLSVLGLFDGVKAYGRVKACVQEVCDEIEAFRPDAVVLIDSWGFMWRVARELKERGVAAKRIKLVGPQVWATRPGRAKVLAQWVDHLLCIHAFEEPFYEPYGLPTTVIGNPALGRAELGDGQQFRRDYGIAEDRVLIGLLLGSRRGELKRVAPELIGAAEVVCAQDPRFHVVCIVADSVTEETKRLATSWVFPHTLVTEATDKSDAMAALEVSIACSGTVTTELAAQGGAMVVGYKLGWLSWAIARLFLLKTKFISLVNVAAGREVVPEFVQTRLKRDLISKTVLELLATPEKISAQKLAQREALGSMVVRDPTGKTKPAAEIAAGDVLKIIG